MRTAILLPTMLGILFAQDALAQYQAPQIQNSCLFVYASPNRPDPRPEPLTTPEERCQAADWFALSNVPTTPVAVITPDARSRFYCTLDGSTIATPFTLKDVDQGLAETLPGATACSGDNVCQQMFGESATCKEFGPDASGHSDNGWTSLGPGSAFSLAAPIDGSGGAHSVYVRTASNLGYIYYFPTGFRRTNSLAAPSGSEILDITMCAADPSNSSLLQRGPPPDCEGFWCRPVECCGPHFPCDGYPNYPPLTQAPEERIAGLDLELGALINGDYLEDGQGRGMRQLLVIISDSLDSGMLDQACQHMDQFINAIGHNVGNGKLHPDAAAPLESEAVSLQVALGCTAPG